MQAMIVDTHGGPEVFTSRELARPKVRPGHLLLEVKATSINPLDVKMRAQHLPWSDELPAVLHGDVAGVVVEIGEGVEGFALGDEVYGCGGGVGGYGGALAEYMLVDADLVARKPRSLSMEDAAALPLVALTAWEGLVDKMRVQAGDRVLVHGATGGVGHVAIQLAKALGARVCATCSQDRWQSAEALGADALIDYRAQGVADYVEQHTAGLGFHAVFDTVGGDNLAKSFAAVRNNGDVAVLLPVNDASAMMAKGISLHSVFMLIPLLSGRGRARHGEILTKVAALVDEGKMKPLIHARRYSLWDVASAHRCFESGKALGKVVLTVEES